MNKTTFILSILAMVFGVCLFVYGGHDDSPGAQLLGALLVIGGTVGILRSRKNGASD